MPTTDAHQRTNVHTRADERVLLTRASENVMEFLPSKDKRYPTESGRGLEDTSAGSVTNIPLTEFGEVMECCNVARCMMMMIRS